MSTIWPAIVAVVGTLAGVAVTQLFAARVRAADFKRDWVRTEAQKRAEVYSAVIATMHQVVLAQFYAIREMQKNPGSPRIQELVNKADETAIAHQQAVLSNIVHISPDMQRLHEETVKEMLAHGSAADLTSLRNMRSTLLERIKLVEQQARSELSLEALAARVDMKS